MPSGDIGSLDRANWYEQSTTASCWNGFRLPARTASLKLRVFEDGRREEELVGKFLAPLLAQVRGHDHEKAPLALGPFLGEQQARFDRLSEPDFVGEDCAL